ncbi:MAG: DUF1428 domain-containing protein [Anderseniella sp.]|jgi:uncharacterized protein YbaA (DUF1428 family)|nr:DUF1428 domain-containing protein [Anderseniella sp.]
MTYVDGFLAAVPNAKKQQYIKHAREASAMFKEFGALKLVECWGDDVPDGKLTSFPMAVKKEEDETVVFSWVLWPSKTVRDEGWQRMMKDERMQMADMPFDGKRMIYGGFEMVVEE